MVIVTYKEGISLLDANDPIPKGTIVLGRDKLSNDFVLPIRGKPLAFELVHEGVEGERSKTGEIGIHPILVHRGIEVEGDASDLLCGVNPLISEKTFAGILELAEFRISEYTGGQDGRVTSRSGRRGLIGFLRSHIVCANSETREVRRFR